jgi:spermidine synthase
MLPHIYRYEITPHVSVCLECKGVLHSSQSKFQKIEVVESLDFGRMLVLDGVINLTERDECMYHEMLAHVPLFSHANPLDILIVGGGDGGTAREVLKHGGTRSIQLVEIDREVMDVSKEYFPSLGSALDCPKVHVLFMDATQYIKDTRDKFDIILIDSTDPVIKQSEGLFTISFYKGCLDALNKGGILAAQVGDISFETNLVLDVFGKMKEAFPIARAYLTPVPSYTILPYGFAFCSDIILPEKGLGLSRFDRGFHTRYYNPQIHYSAFALPEYLKEQFGQ